MPLEHITNKCYKNTFRAEYFNKNSGMKLIINENMEYIFNSDSILKKLLKNNFFISFLNLHEDTA